MKLGGYGATRGHLVRFDEEAWEWVYADTLEPVGDSRSRPCIRCGRYPTEEGHDACLGTLPGGVVAACCGHGIEPPYVMFDDERELHGEDASEYIANSRKEADNATNHNGRHDPAVA
jgi:hypothetical protein